MIKEFGLHLVECAKPLRYLNQEDSRFTYVLGKSMCSFLQIRDACQGPSPRSWSDGGSTEKKQVFRTSWPKNGTTVIYCVLH